jgi:hypothetical protein
MVSGTRFISKMIPNRSRILKKISLKNIPVPSGSGIRKKFIPDPGGKKHRIRIRNIAENVPAIET